MGCNRNRDCKEIYETTYPTLRGYVNSGIDSINKYASETVTRLQGLYIPDDYLGNKLKDKIEELNTKLNTDLDSLSSGKDSVDSFVDRMIEEHRQHYKDWLASLKTVGEPEIFNNDEGSGE